MSVYEIKDKIYGCLYGQAIGDALGLGAEFLSKPNVQRIYPNRLTRFEQIVQDSHRTLWLPGEWTDDTDMMLCILKAFDNGNFNINKIALNFYHWFEGHPRGIGDNMFNVLSNDYYIEQPDICAKYEWKLSNCQSAANGALMRTSVVALPRNYLDIHSESICKLTHYDPRCVGSCVIVTDLIHNLIWNNRNLTFDEVLSISKRYDDRIEEWIHLAYISSEIATLNLDTNESIGYTLRALSAALWCYWHSRSFEEGLISVVNEGGDADTNAAIACSILGAKFGYASIPKYYTNNLRNRNLYYQLTSSFVEKILKIENQ